MSKQGWPHEQDRFPEADEFFEYLDPIARRAGIPDSRKGTPNTTAFEEYTGVNPTQVGRWRARKHRPTTESLRQIANGLGPHVSIDPALLLANLEVKAGLRSEEEAEASGGAPDPLEILSNAQLVSRGRRIVAMMDDPDLEEEDLDELEEMWSMIVAQIKKRRAKARQRAAAGSAEKRQRPSA